jgi:hypothetical protein
LADRKHPAVRPAIEPNGLRALLLPAGLILAITPEANIRVDLLLIAPLLIGLGLWGLVSTLMCLKR